MSENDSMSESDYDGEDVSFTEFAGIILSAPGKHRQTRNDLDAAETAKTFCETDLEAKKTYVSDLDTQISLAKERIKAFPSSDVEKAGSFEPETVASLADRDDEFAQLVSGLARLTCDRTHGNASMSESRLVPPSVPWNPLERLISSPFRHIETEALLEKSKRDMDYLQAQHTEQDIKIRRLGENGKVSTGSTEADFPEKEAKQG
ncbi:hypothetical protein L202_05110 [Cryptococcus amylolentus CBS 6039]|uniref:Uncharacterized protein n=2 Tax=Cryptococcus amylolentus TaxID=104669 RepID=A0A1E3HQM9_9TREE|nr:hypothetical protein L202_05110 [Cryptococcus amylolentus CBS 6039]ODN78026.1 hypothetical protein L202_05110 [Cryptococcus amylolentus CBS 6039]ODO05973.1 hypothetical protein I350_05034 [Cryptococcus amylolentus CBS 6273]